MAIENTNVEEPVAAPAAPEEKKAPEYTPIQLKAIDQGWKPKEEYEGDESDFIDAPEFVRRGELFSKIERQSQEIKATKSAIEALRHHNAKIEQLAYQRAMRDLQKQQKQAIAEGDTQRAFEIIDEINDVQQDAARALAQAQ